MVVGASYSHADMLSKVDSMYVRHIIQCAPLILYKVISFKLLPSKDTTSFFE